MTRDEVITLLALISSLDQRREFAAPDVAAWGMVLGDLPAQAAQAAVSDWYRREVGCVMPADIRRFVADRLGLLPPAEVAAWMQATAVAAEHGEGRATLHPAVREAYDAMGGAAGPLGNRPGDPTVRAQWRDTYRQIAELRRAEALSLDIAGALERMGRAALQGA